MRNSIELRCPLSSLPFPADSVECEGSTALSPAALLHLHAPHAQRAAAGPTGETASAFFALLVQGLLQASMPAGRIPRWVFA